jgi:4-amino-4-deoxy-L-arabinose transferase-like glycosyltransferase
VTGERAGDPLRGASGGGAARPGAIAAALLLLFSLGLGLRVVDIGERSLSHPENFVPGIPVPAWTTVPSPRMSMRDVLVTTLEDGHPPAYFVALVPWVRVFGNSEVSYRMPSALLGALSILLVFAIARRELPKAWALLPAALLALHGFHVHWSQMARPYGMAAFLGLLSTLFLLRHLERERPGDALGLFASTSLGLWTQIYVWPLVFAQMLAGALREWGERGRLRALRVQLAAVVAGSPVIALAILQNPGTKWDDPKLDYLELGFAYVSNAKFWGDAPETHFPPALVLLLTIGLLALCAMRAASRPIPAAPHEAKPPWMPAWLFGDLALVASGAMLALYVSAGATRLVVLATATFPLLLLGLAETLRTLVEPRLRPAPALRRAGEPVSLWIALLPPLLMIAVSAARPSWVARGALPYVPFLLIAVAGGVVALARRPLLASGAAALLAAICVSSTAYFARAQASPRDYRGLARELLPELAPGDAIFVMRSSYRYPPLYYYLPDHLERLVGSDWAEFVERESPHRIWLIAFGRDESELPAEMLAAVSGYRRTDIRHAYRAKAILLERHDAADPQPAVAEMLPLDAAR